MSKFSRFIIGFLGWLFSIGFTLLVIGLAAGFLLYTNYDKDLPDYRQLSRYDPPTLTRLYAANGKLMAEYATEKRIFVPLTAIPKLVRNAFLSAEDKNFYEHTGIDYTGLARAVRNNIVNYGQGKSLVGGSTITQQVVKNFLLSNEKSIERKIKEAILATRITQVYSKDKILELYLNEIYLGLGSYGVAAAAQNYFNKSLDELTIEEVALLAAQPKAPAQYNPKKNYEAAKERRDWVISRMLEDGYITEAQAQVATAAPIELKVRDAADIERADFFAEEVRRNLADMYGSNVLYEGGLVVKTTLNPELQKFADNALRKALIEYDRRRGYRGALHHFSRQDEWKNLPNIIKSNEYQLLDTQKLAIVNSLDEKKAGLLFADNSNGAIPYSLMKWTRRVIADGQLGDAVRKPSDILKIGDVILVNPLSEEEKKSIKEKDTKKIYSLAQIPEINGAMVVIDPHTGKVLAMAGGYAYGGTEFNRATQAKRQPGSAFKPFVYMAGFETGMLKPTTIVLDAPVEMSQGAGMPAWSPSNYHNDYLGEITLRAALEKSRNTVTVRIAQTMGLDKVREMGKRFGIYDDTPRNFSIVLGTAETTLLRLTNAYGMIANGGKRIAPSLIERIDDRHGKTIFRRDTRECSNCAVQQILETADIESPIIADDRERIADPRIIYQMQSILNGVTVRGTAARAWVELKKTVAGKTGTTNDSLDTWFIGFSPDLVVGTFVGYDKPKTLGKKETGASVALPAFIDFMKNALANTENKPFQVPSGIKLVKTDYQTGFPVDPEVPPQGKVVDEAVLFGVPIFIPGVTAAPADGNYEGTNANGMTVNPPDANTQPPTVNPPPDSDDEPTPETTNNPHGGVGGLY